MSSAFHRMRVSVGLESEEEAPSEEMRRWYEKVGFKKERRHELSK